MKVPEVLSVPVQVGWQADPSSMGLNCRCYNNSENSVLVLVRGFEAKASRILVQTLSRTDLTTDKIRGSPGPFKSTGHVLNLILFSLLRVIGEPQNPERPWPLPAV